MFQPYNFNSPASKMTQPTEIKCKGLHPFMCCDAELEKKAKEGIVKEESFHAKIDIPHYL